MKEQTKYFSNKKITSIQKDSFFFKKKLSETKNIKKIVEKRFLNQPTKFWLRISFSFMSGNFPVKCPFSWKSPKTLIEWEENNLFPFENTHFSLSLKICETKNDFWRSKFWECFVGTEIFYENTPISSF